MEARIYIALVVAANSTEPAPASSLRYSLSLNVGGQDIVVHDATVNRPVRLPDEVLARPFKAGDRVPVVGEWVGGMFRAIILGAEPIAVAECAE